MFTRSKDLLVLLAEQGLKMTEYKQKLGIEDSGEDEDEEEDEEDGV